jgi:succinyl-CoA synthetase beta subunit
MDLLEYQAKELFSEVGIPILPSQPLEDPSELKHLQIPYPVVLKSQVRAGGRGRAGGVRFVENTIDAIAAARAIFNLPIMGQYPQVVLAEARYDSQQEFLLAVVLDYQLQRPVLLGSAKGGIDVETLLEHLQIVVVEADFSAFYARHLAIKMGLKGQLIQSVSTIIEKMYHLFISQDLDLVEINPLGLGAEGEVMALDGKISVNDSALGRHPEIELLMTLQESGGADSVAAEELTTPKMMPKPRWLEGINRQGNIGIIGNSVGLALSTWDLIVQNKGKPACCLVIGEAMDNQLSWPTCLEGQLKQALTQISRVPGLKSVLVNILANSATSQDLTQAIAAYFQPSSEQILSLKGEERMERPTASISRSRRQRSSQSRPQQQSSGSLSFVIRLVGLELDSIKNSLGTIPVYWTDNLEQAVTQAISLTKSK